MKHGPRGRMNGTTVGFTVRLMFGCRTAVVTYSQVNREMSPSSSIPILEPLAEVLYTKPMTVCSLLPKLAV